LATTAAAIPATAVTIGESGEIPVAAAVAFAAGTPAMGVTGAGALAATTLPTAGVETGTGAAVASDFVSATAATGATGAASA